MQLSPNLHTPFLKCSHSCFFFSVKLINLKYFFLLIGFYFDLICEKNHIGRQICSGLVKIWCIFLFFHLRENMDSFDLFGIHYACIICIFRFLLHLYFSLFRLKCIAIVCGMADVVDVLPENTIGLNRCNPSLFLYWENLEKMYF